jgi:hypothetical protein
MEQPEKEPQPKANQELVKNENGSYVFLGLAALFTVLAILQAFSVASSQKFLLALPILVCLVATVDLVLCVYYRAIFQRRFLHSVLTGLAALCNLAVLSFVSETRTRIVFESLQLLLCLCLHGLVPTDSPAARLLLPWCAGQVTADSQAQDVEMQQQTGTPKHTHQIRHRTLSVFHDWPAPIPFPARTLFPFKTNSPSELPFSKGDELTILDCRGNWWQARHPVSGQIGFVPSNFIAVRQKARVLNDMASSGPDSLTVQSGQTVEVMEVHESACLCRGPDGKIGSVPSEHLELLPS